jgi:hypothetical protein
MVRSPRRLRRKEGEPIGAVPVGKSIGAVPVGEPIGAVPATLFEQLYYPCFSYQYFFDYLSSCPKLYPCAINHFYRQEISLYVNLQ